MQVVPHLINQVIDMILEVAQSPVGSGQLEAEKEVPAVVMMEVRIRSPEIMQPEHTRAARESVSGF